MPVDPSVIGGLRPVAFNTPFESLGAMMQLRAQQQQIRSQQAAEDARRQDIEKQRRAEADQQQFYRILSTSKNADEAAEKIRVSVPSLYEPFLKQRAELDDKAADLKKKQQELTKLQQEAAIKGQEYAGPLMQLVEKGNYDPGLFDFALGAVKSHFENFPADEYRQKAQGNPQIIKQIVESLKSPQQQNADRELATAQAELPGKVAQSEVQQQIAAGMQGGISAEQRAQNALREREVRASEQNARTATSREGREQKQFDATYGSLQGSAGTDNPLAKAIAEYRSPPVSPRAMASGPGKALMEDVMRLNPDYDASQFPTRQRTRIAFTSGPQSQTLNSLNTAIAHLDQFVDVAKALDNGSFQPGNQVFNWFKTTFGNSAPTNFEGIKQIMSGELASAFKKSGATDQEIAGVERAIASKNSASQLIDYATKIAMPALGSKADTFNAQYHQVMGARDPWKAIYPEAAQALRKYGHDPDHPTMGGQARGTMTLRNLKTGEVRTGPRG